MGARFFAPVQTGPEVHQASYTLRTGSFPGVKRPGRGVDNPLPSSAEVKERVWLYLYSLSGPSWPALGRPLHFTHYLLVSSKSHVSFTKHRYCLHVATGLYYNSQTQATGGLVSHTSIITTSAAFQQSRLLAFSNLRTPHIQGPPKKCIHTLTKENSTLYNRLL